MLTRQEVIEILQQARIKCIEGMAFEIEDDIKKVQQYFYQQPEKPMRERKPISSCMSVDSDGVTAVITTCDDGTQWLLRSISEKSLLEGYEKLRPIPQDDEVKE